MTNALTTLTGIPLIQPCQIILSGLTLYAGRFGMTCVRACRNSCTNLHAASLEVIWLLELVIALAWFGAVNGAIWSAKKSQHVSSVMPVSFCVPLDSQQSAIILASLIGYVQGYMKNNTVYYHTYILVD